MEGFKVQGLGFRVQGLGFWVQGLGVRVNLKRGFRGSGLNNLRSPKAPEAINPEPNPKPAIGGWGGGGDTGAFSKQQLHWGEGGGGPWTVVAEIGFLGLGFSVSV